MTMNNLIDKQRELMEKVPHELRPGALIRMGTGLKLMDTLLRYMNSTGHKPWRPKPLPSVVQKNLLITLGENYSTLKYIHQKDYGAEMDFSNIHKYARQVVSAYGIIEETIEYVNTLSPNDLPMDRAHQLEELTDILFFYLEQIILSEFSWEEVEQEYVRKHAVNLERYRKAAEGDFSWDKRDKGGL